MNKLTLVAIAFLVLIGCAPSTKLPTIPGYHWVRHMTGATLYDSNGLEVAVWVKADGDSAMACVFHVGIPCQFRETNKEALDWLASHVAI
jgi:hypothetical protein